MSQIQQKIEILKEYFKIFAYEYVGQILTPNIHTFCRDDLLTDRPTVTDAAVSF
jgi:hypothetical protein